MRYDPADAESPPSQPSPADSISTRLDRLIEQKSPAGSFVSALFLESDSGEVLYSRDPDRNIRPASNMKLVTTWAYLTSPHTDRIATTLHQASDGTLILVGGGDPLLSEEDLSELVRQARSAITRPPRRVVVDASRFQGDRFGRGWMWDDEPGAFMPHLSALTVHQGTVTISASVAGGKVEYQVAPDSLHTPVRTIHRPGSNQPVSISRNWRSMGSVITIEGDFHRPHSSTRSLSVPAPDLHAGSVLVRLLAEAGLPAQDVTPTRGHLPADAVHIASKSRDPWDVIKLAHKPSNNLAAECLLRLAGGHSPGMPQRGLEQVKDRIRDLGLDPDRYELADGSGVSHYNLISTSLLVAILADMRSMPESLWGPYRDSLAIGGRDGTLARRFRGTSGANHVFAKTGTISGASCLAGYAIAENGRSTTFAIACQNSAGPAGPQRELQDAMVLAILEALQGS